jgi:glycogen debranching enzyme
VADAAHPDDPYAVRAAAEASDERTLVLKHGDTFAVFDQYGDIGAFRSREQGLFHAGTRYLSQLWLRLGDVRPVLLSSAVLADNAATVIDLTNPDIQADDGAALPHGTLHIARSAHLRDGVCHEHVTVTSYAAHAITIALAISVDADFADIFEVRGTVRRQRGHKSETDADDGVMRLRYTGLDGIERLTTVASSPAPDHIVPGELRFSLRLDPLHPQQIAISIRCDASSPGETWMAGAGLDGSRPRFERCGISTSHPRFNNWLERSLADLRMLVSETHYGLYPYAGVPWFSTPFGRDGIITALQTLWVAPDIARGVLAFLAATQASDEDPARDAEPGKIVHEMRAGELAALGEIPFGRYYGSADATPLFVMLAGAYYRASGDLDFVRLIWPNVEAALGWIDTYGDIDGDGFVEYARREATGLLHQGWKDSQDSVFHADGRAATLPIALCEIQGYVYAAKQAAAYLARALGHDERSDTLTSAAETLRARIDQAFWDEELGGYALALDGNKQPCCVRSSNAGHLLYCGVPQPEHAARLATTLLSPDSFTGWGIRTIASGQARYSPLSYHNGSVWPHDTALVAAGLGNYGFREGAARLLSGMFDAAQQVDLLRLPELFCGFERQPGIGPTRYPTACSPQAWAASVPYVMLQAVLGMTVEGHAGRLTFQRPDLPTELQELRLHDLRVGQGHVDVVISRADGRVAVEITRNVGGVVVSVQQ